MKVLLVSGIYPPDIGGPATHTSELARELTARGHGVSVLAPGDVPGVSAEREVTRLPRSWPWPRRNLAALRWILANAGRFDIVYATGLAPVAVAAARARRIPVVVKVVSDPAWERSTRRQLTTVDFEEFQRDASGPFAVRAMRRLRSWSTRHATKVIAPSDHLRQAAERWSGRDDITVIPNGAAGAAPKVGPRDEGTLRVAFVGRLVPVKRVELLVDAIAHTSGVHLDIVGSGPEEPALVERARAAGVSDRIAFLGMLAHERVLEHLASADALGMASTHEGLPHVVLEALASGLPVVTTKTAGVDAVIVHDVNGLVVADATSRALADAFMLLKADPALRARLHDGALATSADWRFESTVDQIEHVMRVALDGKPRAIFFGKTSVALPTTPDHEQKFAIHGRDLDSVLVCTARRAHIGWVGGAKVVGFPTAGPRALSSAVFYAIGPLVVMLLSIGRRPTAVVCQSPFEGFGVIVVGRALPRRFRPRVQIELHGDWQTATRLYGSRHRRFVSRGADLAASWALRRADRVRAVSELLVARARDAGYNGPVDRFAAFSDYSAFFDPPPAPLPDRARALFVGVLERPKGIDTLLDAWPTVRCSLPHATLTLVGTGRLEVSIADRIQREQLSDSVRLLAPVPRRELRRLLDASWCLVLASRSEGLPRIILEAMAAGRPVVATRVGGIGELVTDAVGRLVPPDDASALASALIELLGDARLSTTMGLEARRRALELDPLGQYAAGINRLAQWIATP